MTERERVRDRLKALVIALVAPVALVSAEPVLACAVCFGDPSAPTSKGVQAGVLVLLGVVVVVLTAFGSLLVFWMRRAANLRALEGVQAADPVASRASRSIL